MNGITWKVKLKTVQCLIFGLLFSIGKAQFQRQRERDFGFSDFPVPQSFQQLRIFTPSRELGNGDDRVRVNQFSHQFFHPVPAPPSNFAQTNPSARRPSPQSGVPTELPLNPRSRNLQNESGSKRQNSGRNLPIDNSLDIRDKDQSRSRPEPVGRKIQPLDSSNRLIGKGSESTTTGFTFGTKLEKSTESLLQTLNKATPTNTLNPDKSTIKEEEVSNAHLSSDTFSEEEEDYYVYYDEEDLPEELRKLLEEGADEPLVIERVTTQVKSAAKIPSTTLVPSEQPTNTDLEEIPLLEINIKKEQITDKPVLKDESESETSSKDFEEIDTLEYENEVVSEDQPINSTEDDSEFQSEEEEEISDSFETNPEVDEQSTPVLSTTEGAVPVTVADVPVKEILNVPSIRPFRRPFRPNRFRPAPRRFPERGNKVTFFVEENGNEQGERNGEKTVVSVATTKSVVSRITDSISIAEITPRPSSDRGSKAIGGQKSEVNSISRPKISENISDKLDKFQSELSDSFLFGGAPPSPPQQSERPKFIYPKSPLEIIKDLKVGPPDDSENNETPDSDTTTIKVLTTTADPPSSLVEILNNQTEKTVVSKSFNKLFDSLETDSLDGLLPPDFKTSSTTTFENPTESIATTELSLIDRLLMKSKNALSGLVPKDFTSDSLEGLLPSGFSLEGTTEISETTKGVVDGGKHENENSANSDTLAGLLPPGFKFEDDDIEQDSLDGLLPPGFKLEESTSKKSSIDLKLTSGIAEDDISKFLPKGFKLTEKPSEPTPPPQTEDTSEISKSRLVFPTRPGRLGSKTTTSQKPSIKTTTTEPIVIKTGWPVRATTEFTGWPTPNTTATLRSTTPIPVPISFVELTTMTTTLRPMTTTLPPVPRVNGTCIDSCKIAASLRVVNGIDWSGELANPLTSEYRSTATFFKVQLDGVYRSSALAQYYRGIDIEGFSPGSVIVDYYVHLALPTSESSLNAINASDIRTLFHQALNDGFEGLHFGNFTVDPRASSFVVLSENSSAAGIESESDTSLFPSWAIAVIVIGLLSLLLVVSFGVTMLMRRRRVSQVKKAVPLSEEMLNELNKTSQGVDNYALEDPYDLGPLPIDPWNDLSKISRPRPLPARRPASSTGIPNRNLKNFNPGIYDSWKSEWNGQLASYTSNQSNHYAPGSSYSLSRDLLPNNQARNPEVRRPGSSLANRFNMVHDWGRGYTNTALVNNYTSDWVAATGRSSSLGRGFGIESGWSPSVFQGSNRSSAARTLRRPTDYDNEF